MTNQQQPPQTPDGTQPGGSQSNGFFGWVRGIGLRRSDDRWIAGVCGGVAERTGLDPLLVRGIAIVIALLGGPIFLAYAAGWALLPDAGGRIHLERMIRGIFDPALVGIGILLVLTFAPFGQGIWWRGTPDWWGMPDWFEAMLRTGWIIVLVGGVIWLVVVLARKAPQHDPKDPNGPRSHEQYWGGSFPQGGGQTDAGAAAFGSATSTGAQPAGTATGPTPGANFDGTPMSGANTGAATSGSWEQHPYAADPNTAWNQQPGAAWGQNSYAEQRHAYAQQRQAEARARHEERMRENARRRAENAARWRERQPSAGYVAISLGLAVLGGAVAALAAFSAGWPETALVFGIAGALVVLALATIVAGIRGRENGGLGFFSTVAVIALIFVGIVPSGAHFSAFGDTRWSVDEISASETTSYVAGLGAATLDLRDVDDSSSGNIDLWLGLGSTEVILPDDVPVVVYFNGAGATVEPSGDVTVNGTPRGLFSSAVVQNKAAETAAESDIITVHVRVLFGSADVVGKETA
ncbi:PspC domain-containing protein [Paramicrobacterium sp. CJ85]|uniref:PspC domain-containing protein n=1 Tax=Paramicrobacterium sp. CJ85 TaxID=3445355 RepID=UPI003F5F206B